MRTATLHPLCLDDQFNASGMYRRRLQVLGTILALAYRAEAVTVFHEPTGSEPLQYRNASGQAVQSELPQPPDEIHGELHSLFQDAVGGHPVLLLFRRLLGRLSSKEQQVKLRVMDAEIKITSVWEMTVGPAKTVLKLVSTETYRSPWRLNREDGYGRTACDVSVHKRSTL